MARRMPTIALQAPTYRLPLVAQRSLGVATGAGIKLVYEHRVLGSENCLTRAMRRMAMRAFNAKQGGGGNGEAEGGARATRREATARRR